MSSQKEYLFYILEQLSYLEDITYRPMMGEYLIYYRDKVIGGLYDNRFLIKDVNCLKELMTEITYEIPYSGAKKMILIKDIENKQYLKQIIETMYEELPIPQSKKKK
ncbi:MAG: TfoX/Sxy family protein [Longibaculum sp.]